MTKTPSANRLHIGIFGRCNSGKSSLINAITGQRAAIVSDVAGTTTDLVTKPMEIAGLGPCLFIDTAGFDDSGPLADDRIALTKQAVQRSDIALMLCAGPDMEEELRWIEMLRAGHIPVIPVINRNDNRGDTVALEELVRRKTGCEAVTLNAGTGEGMDALLRVLRENKTTETPHTITGNLAQAGDTVVLVMPQDKQAPAGRLILPQAQTLRELLDKRCVAVCCQPADFDKTLASLNAPPALVIADSQVVGEVCGRVPQSTAVTTFSLLYGSYKGDARSFAEGARAIGRLTVNSRVLIAEACAHAPLEEDIGRVKIPRMLCERTGGKLRIDVASGTDFPEDLAPYDLIIHCGACLFNRRYVMARLKSAGTQHVPMTNYGMAIAYMKGVLDRMSFPSNTNPNTASL